VEDVRLVKPLGKNLLLELSKKYNDWYIFSESQKQCGEGSVNLELLNGEKIHNIQLTSFEYNDKFIEHGDTKLVEQCLGLLPEQLVQKIK
ncbi:1-deoxy-D-xylulose-5-phosphate synthase, partial [Aliarcobacter butzleri]